MFAMSEPVAIFGVALRSPLLSERPCTGSFSLCPEIKSLLAYISRYSTRLLFAALGLFLTNISAKVTFEHWRDRSRVS